MQRHKCANELEIRHAPGLRVLGCWGLGSWGLGLQILGFLVFRAIGGVWCSTGELRALGFRLFVFRGSWCYTVGFRVLVFGLSGAMQ